MMYPNEYDGYLSEHIDQMQNSSYQHYQFQNDSEMNQYCQNLDNLDNMDDMNNFNDLNQFSNVNDLGNFGHMQMEYTQINPSQIINYNNNVNQANYLLKREKQIKNQINTQMNAQLRQVFIQNTSILMNIVIDQKKQIAQRIKRQNQQIISQYKQIKRFVKLGAFNFNKQAEAKVQESNQNQNQQIIQQPKIQQKKNQIQLMMIDKIKKLNNTTQKTIIDNEKIKLTEQKIHVKQKQLIQAQNNNKKSQVQTLSCDSNNDNDDQSEYFGGQDSYLIQQDEEIEKKKQKKLNRRSGRPKGVNLERQIVPRGYKKYNKDVYQREYTLMSEFLTVYLCPLLEYPSKKQFYENSISKKQILIIYLKWKKIQKSIDSNEQEAALQIIQGHLVNFVKKRFPGISITQTHIIGLMFKDQIDLLR